jgi:hypothetical protein
MTTIQKYYAEWLSADQMHEASKEWLSELRFINDEHSFFEDLITKFTSELLEFGKFSDKIEIIDAINWSQMQNNLLIEAVKKHENELLIMVDGINQIEEEESYRKEHKDLVIDINDFLKYYKALKMQLFDIIKKIRKEEKTRRLLARK